MSLSLKLSLRYLINKFFFVSSVNITADLIYYTNKYKISLTYQQAGSQQHY